MKRLIFGTIVLALMASVSMAAPTNPYSPDLATIQGMTKTWDGGGTTSSGLTVTPVAGAVVFAANMQSGNGLGSGWASMGLGYPWPTSPPVSDLSSYDGYSLDFVNTNNSNWLVNLYMNTGWTDGPDGNPATPGDNETDRFYQNGWVELAPGAMTRVTLDFASADLWIAGVQQAPAAVVNANHVTNIGFQVGGNMTNPWSLPNPSNPDNYHIAVSPIPAPGAILLGSIGVSLVGWLRRRRML